MPANRFCFAEHAIVSRSLSGGWSVSKLDGTSVEMSDKEFSRRGYAVDCAFGENGFYAILDSFREHLSYSYRPDPEAGVVWLENGPCPVPMHEFLMMSVRADAAGKPICSFLSEADQQLYAASNAGAEGHVSEIVDGVTAQGAYLVRDWIEAAGFRNGAAGLDNDEFLSMVA
ncbi:hypothetical protein D3C71_607680 [compost metagenome]